MSIAAADGGGDVGRTSTGGGDVERLQYYRVDTEIPIDTVIYDNDNDAVAPAVVAPRDDGNDDDDGNEDC